MDKLLLEKYVKVAVKKALKEQEELEKKSEKSIYLVYRFPGLRKTMEDLMSPAFGNYITEVSIVAPKPTIFKVKLINHQEFSLIYNGKNKFTANIAGRRYFTDNIGELQRASKGISDLLQLNYAPEEGKDLNPNPPLPDGGNGVPDNFNADNGGMSSLGSSGGFDPEVAARNNDLENDINSDIPLDNNLEPDKEPTV